MRLRCREGRRHIDEANQSNVAENLAFSKKVAEGWEIRLRCREGRRHIDEANQSNVTEDLLKVLRCGEKKLHWAGIFEKGCGGLGDKVALQRR